MGFDSWSLRDKIVMSWGLIIASIALIFICVSLGNLISDNSANIASWVQAIGSIAAIGATGYLTRWQFKKNKKFLEHKKILDQLDLCDVCEQMCNASISIFNIKSQDSINFIKMKNNLLKKSWLLNLNSIDGLGSRLSEKETDEVEDTVEYSLERINDLQETLRVLISKDLPVVLIKAIFYLQKYAAQYKGFIIRYPDYKNLIEVERSKESRYYRMIIQGVHSQKKIINLYREDLKKTINEI